MSEIAQLLEQLERAEVAPPTPMFEEDLWAALEAQLDDRPWWYGLRPSAGVIRRTVTAVAFAGLVLALLVGTVWLVRRDTAPPPVIDQGPIELEPLPSSLIGGTLPPFRAMVEVRPNVDEPETLVWEISFDGEAGFRQELVEVRAGAGMFPVGAFVVTDGREIGRLDGLSVTADGVPLFRIEPAAYPLAAPLSWDLSWGPYCDEPTADDEVVACSDWRGNELQLARHGDSGLVTLVRGHITELAMRDPFQQRAGRSLVVEGAGGFGAPGDPVGEVRVVDVTWDPTFEEGTFDVVAPEGTVPARDGDFDDAPPDWSETIGPPDTAFAFTASFVPVEDDGRDGSQPVTWRFAHDPDRGWRAEAVSNGDPRWEPHVGSLEVSDGEHHWFYDAASATHGELETTRPRNDLIQQVLAAYLDDVSTMEGAGDLTSYLASSACQQTATEPVAGVSTTVYDCERDDAVDRFWVHEDTSLVLRRGQDVPGIGMHVWHEVDAFEIDPDLSALEVTFTPPPGSVSETAEGVAVALVEGEPAPGWRSPLLAGGELSSSQVTGQVTVVLFQAEDCPVSALQCRAFDLLMEVAAEETDVVAAWVPNAEFVELPQRVVNARGFSGHVLTDDGAAQAGPIRAWGINGRVWDPRTPTVTWVVLAPDGRVVLLADADATKADLATAIDQAKAVD